ncbi:MAG: hypothetical protein U1E85_08655 [Rhodocyclaceae bacterium]
MTSTISPVSVVTSMAWCDAPKIRADIAICVSVWRNSVTSSPIRIVCRAVPTRSRITTACHETVHGSPSRSSSAAFRTRSEMRCLFAVWEKFGHQVAARRCSEALEQRKIHQLDTGMPGQPAQAAIGKFHMATPVEHHGDQSCVAQQ